MLFKICKLVFIFHFIRIYLGFCTSTSQDTHVCILEKECIIPVNQDHATKSFYISPDNNCLSTKLGVKLELKNVGTNYFIKWTPEVKYIGTESIKLCTFNKDNLLSPLEVKTIQLKQLEYEYSLDDNNDLDIVLTNFIPEANDVKLVISNTELHTIKAQNDSYLFVKFYDKLVSHAPLFKLLEKSKAFTAVYVYIHYHNISSHPTLLERLIIFNIDKVTSLKRDVAEKYIVAEIKGVDLDDLKTVDTSFNNREPKDFFFLSAQSKDDSTGIPSKCGSPDTLWHILDLPYKINGQGNDKSIIILLPLELYGKPVKLCAGFKKEELKNYYMYLYTFGAINRASKYFKNEFYASPLGVAEIALESDFHPLSEIMLINPCDLDSKDELRQSFTNLNKCKPITEPRLAHRQVNAEYKANHSYDVEDLYLSIYNKAMFANYLVASKPMYLPDKSVLTKTGTKWIKKPIFLPGLYSDHEFPYVMLLCDRWKHTFCFTKEEFDTPIGIIKASDYTVHEVTSSWSRETLSVSLKMRVEKPPVIKLVMSKDVQYANYESKCNSYKGTYPPIPNPPRKKAAFYTHVYKTDRLLQGRLYYICVLKVKNQADYPESVKKFYPKQNPAPSNSLETRLYPKPRWNFVGIVNTQTVISDTRYSFNKLEKQGNYVFPTTGFSAELLISGIYFSKNMLLDCERLRSSHRLPIPQNKYEFSDLVSFVKNCRDTFAPVKRPIVLPKSDGFWLSKDKKHWKMKGKYISYSGPFKPTENTYKVCVCIHKECYFSGNATNSRIDSFSLSQFVKINDFFDRIVIGNLLCIYNRRLAMCYDARDNFKLSIEHELEFYLPQIQINHISFDDYTNLVCILSPNIIYVYENNFEAHMKIMNVLDMKQMFSFPNVTFFLDVDTLYAYIDKLSIHQAIVGSMNDFGFTSQNIEYDHEPLRRDEPEKMISLDIPINDKTANLNIIKGDTNNVFDCFLVNEKLELIYYQITVNIGAKQCTTNQVTKLDLKEHFPAATDGIILEVDKRSLFGLDVQIFFASHHEYDDIKIFFLKHNNFTFYSDVKAIKGIRDFVFTKTHIICLGSLLLQDELTQQIIQIEYDNLFDVTLSYPTIEQVIYGNEYSFDATVSSNFVLKYYLDPNKSHIDIPRGAPIQFEIKRSGLSLNSSTGQITGRANFVGPLEQTIYVDAFLSKGSTTVRFVSKCPLGYQAGGNNTCEKCPKGSYRHKIAIDGCVSCEDYLKHSTTNSDGTQSPLECVCNPGFFKSNNLCVECPAGTYNNDLGALACDGTCPKNQESQVTGASSLEELRCACVRGFYMGEYQCERCVPGTYCPGNSKVVRCPENSTTRQPGSSRPEDCVCVAGYELVENVCRPCDTRSYKPTVGNERCRPCSLDSYDIQSFTRRPGAITKVECNRCQPGHHFNGTSCAFCPENAFCKGGGFQPVKCGENAIIKKETATGLYDCLCPRGYGFNSLEFNSLRPRDCVKCPLNTFQFIDGTHQPCIECPENTYTLAEGSTSLLDCIPLSGYFTPTQSEYSEKVRALEANHQSQNEQQLQSLATKCFRASALAMSYHVVLARRFDECVQLCKSNPHCKHLYYRAMGGNYNNLFSEGANNICATYTTFDPKIPDKIGEEPVANPMDADGPLLCEIEREYVYPKFMPCSRNHYCPGGISSQRIKCPQNAVTLHEGAASPDECLCLPGRYLHNGACVPCKPGHFKPAVSNAACTSCPENMTTAQQGSLAPTQCACVNNTYAVPLKRSADAEIRRLIYVGDQQSVLDDQHIDNNIDKIIQQTFEVPATTSLDYYCAYCERGYFCRGLWLSRNVHMPPVPCFPGSSVPASASSHSIRACLCDPGHGTSQQEFETDAGFGLLCEPCPPGTFKAVHENSACHGTCPAFATSRPGSSSERDCFCLPGYYMRVVDGQMSCRACPEGMECHGGLDGAAHTRPTPRPGFALVSLPPPDVTKPASLLQNELEDHAVACPHPDRCVGENRCSEGSAGLLCTECARGYDTQHFGSACTACQNELGKVALRRAPLYLFLVALYYYSFFFDCHSDSPLIPALKITHAFLASLTPLGLMHSTSGSSLRAHRRYYNAFIESGFWSYTKTARLNCFRDQLLSLIRLLGKIGPKSQATGPEQLEYRHIWYLQRYSAILGLLFDVCAVLLIGAVCQLVNWLIRLHNRKIIKKLDSFAATLDDGAMSLASVHTEHDLVEVRSRRRSVYRPLLATLVLVQLPHVLLNCLAMLRCVQLPPAGRSVLLFMPSQLCSTSDGLFLAGLVVGCATMGLIAAFVAFLFFWLARCTDASGWKSILASGCRPRYRYWYLVQLVRQTLMVGLVAMQLSLDAAASETFVQASVLAVHVGYLFLLRSLEPYDARAGSLLAYMDTKYTCVTIFAALFLLGAQLYHCADYALLPLVAAVFCSLSVSASVAIALTSFLCTALNGHWPLKRLLRQFPLLFNYANAFLYFNYKRDTLVFESSNLVRRANALCGLYVHTRQDRRFLLRCLSDLTRQCVLRQSGRSFSRRFFYFYVRLIFWYARCLDTNALGAAPLDYVAFLYYFDEALRPRVCWLLFHYPLNGLRSHLSYYHQSFRCEEGCKAFHLRPPNECVDELAACLLADLLFERHYDSMRLSLADFHHALLALSRIEPAKISRVFEFYQRHLEFVRHRGRYMHSYELGRISSEISTLKELIKLDDRQGALKVGQQELAEQLELLKRDVARLSESLEHRSRVVDAARKNFTRASVLKVGVESVIAGKLTNDDILGSISRLDQGSAEPRSASILKSKRAGRESVYKLKLT